MASEEIRKNLGKIFMGAREATVEELHAMQEPALRERTKKLQQEDYLDRVRGRAEDKARAILGAAYAERQKVLEEARDEAAKERIKIVGDVEQLKIDAERAYDKAAEELANAQAIREEAERLRAAAREDGLKQGMDQAGDELKAFRAEIGQSLARVLQAIDGQRGAICNSWCDEITELVRVAVAAGTGWIVQTEHDRILRGLVMKSLNLLEDRAIITIRVNPEDEASVGDMFRAAREKVPELRQWIVTGDEAVERGGLVAESGSGSVDCRRERFREMVNGVLAYLSLPGREQDEQDARDLHKIVLTEVEKAALLAPPLPTVEDMPDVDPDQDLHDARAAALAEQMQIGAGPEMENAGEDHVAPEQPGPANAGQADAMPAASDALPGDMAELAGPEQDVPGMENPELAPRPDLPDSDVPAPDVSAPDAQPSDASPHAGAIGGDLANAVPAAGGNAHNNAGPARRSSGDPAPENWIPPLGVPADAAVKQNPSLEELEEELFPLDGPDGAGQQQIFAEGGFLPAPGDGGEADK